MISSVTVPDVVEKYQKSPAPVALARFREFHLDLGRRAPFDPLYHIRLRQFRWDREEHVDMVTHQNTLYDIKNQWLYSRNVCMQQYISNRA